MEKKLIRAYLAYKALRTSSLVKKNFDVIPLSKAQRQQVINEILMFPTTVLKQKDFIDTVQKIAKRSNKNFSEQALKYFHKNISFDAIADYYSGKSNFLLKPKRSEILAFFAAKSGAKNVDNKPIDSNHILRPMLIDLVEALEFLTGRPLATKDNQPLAYLDAEASFGDIADYFSVNGSAKIAKIREKICPSEDLSVEKQVELFRGKVINAYAEQIGKTVDKDFLQLKVMEQNAVDYKSSDSWEMVIAWTEDEVKVLIFHYLHKVITPESTVEDLVNLFCEEKKKGLQKTQS